MYYENPAGLPAAPAAVRVGRPTGAGRVRSSPASPRIFESQVGEDALLAADLSARGRAVATVKEERKLTDPLPWCRLKLTPRL